jgi:hypothetical protein
MTPKTILIQCLTIPSKSIKLSKHPGTTYRGTFLRPVWQSSLQRPLGRKIMRLPVRFVAISSSVTLLVACAMIPRVAVAQITVQQYQDQLHETWRHTMHHMPAPQEGCYHASFPSTEWEKVECAAPPAYKSASPNRRTQTLGNGADYVAQAPSGHTFTSVTGSFPTVTGVTSEKGVNVPFGSGESDGITGANQYTLQVNTNIVNTAACASYKGCYAWQQYVISTDTPVSLTSSQLTKKTEVFIEYWLINYGASTRATCPKGFINGGADSTGVDCVQNTPAVVIYNGQLPATQLASLALTGTAAANGTDKAVATYGTEAYTASVADSLTDISSKWTQAEFNVVGNAGGSEAQFNKGSSLTVKVAVTDGSTTAPTCLAPSSEAGTTGETNNLSAKSCTGTGGSAPYIEFTESY